MSLVGFKYRRSKPINPSAGCFYWVDAESNKSQIWFAPDSNPEHLLLLSDVVDESKINELISLVTSTNEKVDEIEGRISGLMDEILGEIDSRSYLTESDLTGYAKSSDIPTKVSELENDEGYLKEHQDLTGYAKSTDIPQNVGDLINNMGYLTESDLPDYLTESDLDEFVTKDELRGQVEDAMEGYNPELADSDWDAIDEKIANKVDFRLTWKQI